jgi:hypothetical protein
MGIDPNFRGGPCEQAFHNNIKAQRQKVFLIQMAEEEVCM